MDPRLNHLNLKTSLSALLDLVLPRVCVVCGRPLIPQERHLCLECLSDLPETRYAPLGHNPMADRFNAKIQVDEYEPYAYAAALYHYRAESGYKKISQALKYHRDFGTGRWAAHRAGRAVRGAPAAALPAHPEPGAPARRGRQGGECDGGIRPALFGAACRPAYLVTG